MRAFSLNLTEKDIYVGIDIWYWGGDTLRVRMSVEKQTGKAAETKDIKWHEIYITAPENITSMGQAIVALSASKHQDVHIRRGLTMVKKFVQGLHIN